MTSSPNESIGNSNFYSGLDYDARMLPNVCARARDTHRNGEFGGQVRGTVGGEDSVGARQWPWLGLPKAGERFAVCAAQPGLGVGVDVDVLDREIYKVLDVVEEAAAV